MRSRMTAPVRVDGCIRYGIVFTIDLNSDKYKHISESIFKSNFVLNRLPSQIQTKEA